MNKTNKAGIFTRIYCRTFQKILHLGSYLLPFKEPKLLTGDQAFANLAKIMRGKNIKSFLIITDKTIHSLGLTEQLKSESEKQGINYFVYDDVVANPTIYNVEEALQAYLKNNCDAIVGFGGGSAIDCAKAVAARVARPKKTVGRLKGLFKVLKRTVMTVAVPTTSGTGSEATVASVITDSEARHKYAINDLSLIPHYAVLSPHLTFKMPSHITATTGMDALTHAVEAYIGNSLTPKTKRCATAAVDLILKNILTAYSQPDNYEARSAMQRAAYLAGVAFTRSYVGNVHAISHAISGMYGTPHGLANSVILPVVLEVYGNKAVKKLSRLAAKTGVSELKDKNANAKAFIGLIYKLNNDMNIGKTLALKPQDFDILAGHAVKEANPLYPVPVIFTKDDFVDILNKVKQ